MRRGALAVSAIAVLSITVGGSAAADTASPVRDSIRVSEAPVLRTPSRPAIGWCGAGQAVAVDRTPGVDVSSTRTVHVTYALPADAPDQYAARVGPIVSDMAAIDGWWREQDVTRTLRFDLYPFPNCATRLGKLDIGFVRLPRSGNLYLGESGADRLLSDLTQLAALTSEKHLVYYDGPNVFDEHVCGTSFVNRNAPTTGGLSGIAFVWLRSLCAPDLGTGRLAATVAVHEVIHGLGALLQGSPNECDPPDDGHVCDSPTDILYPEANDQTSLATQILDINRDDYYGHSLATFDVQDSGWLTHLPQFHLAVALTGKGGSVRLTAPSSFQCTANCTLDVDQGASVTLVAAPAPATRFLGWSGACTGAGACTLTMNAATSVSARFGTASFRLTVSVAGKGKVVSSPSGVACPGRCSAVFKAGTTVRLRSKPDTGFRFVGWTGTCRGTSACLVPVDRDRSARAIFRRVTQRKVKK